MASADPPTRTSGSSHSASQSSVATARATATSNAPGRCPGPTSSTRSARTVTLDSPSAAAVSRRNAAFFCVDSISTTDRSGRTIASGMPGTPGPLPTSATRAGPAGRNGSSVSASPTCCTSAVGRSVMRVRFIRALAAVTRSR